MVKFRTKKFIYLLLWHFHKLLVFRRNRADILVTQIENIKFHPSALKYQNKTVQITHMVVHYYHAILKGRENTILESYRVRHKDLVEAI